MIVRFFLARLVKRIHADRLLVGVFLAGAAGCVLAPLATDGLTLGAIAFFYGLGMGIGVPLTVILMYESSSKGRSGQTLGMRLTANNLVRMGGPMVFGTIGAAFGLSGVFWVLGTLMLGGGLLSHWQRTDRAS